MGLDLDIFQLLNGLAKYSGLLDVIVIFFASLAIYILGLGVILATLYGASRKTQYYRAVFLALSLLLARGFVVPAIRFFYDRPRPFMTFPEITTLVAKATSEPSFPSGHAAIAFALAGVMYYMKLQNDSWWKYATIIAALIALARVVAGVHYPSDILVGAAIGWGGAWVAKTYFLRPTSKV